MNKPEPESELCERCFRKPGRQDGIQLCGQSNRNMYRAADELSDRSCRILGIWVDLPMYGSKNRSRYMIAVWLRCYGAQLHGPSNRISGTLDGLLWYGLLNRTRRI